MSNIFVHLKTAPIMIFFNSLERNTAKPKKCPMKNLLTLFCCLVIGSTQLQAQTGVEDMNEVDPRQYLEIYENVEEPTSPKQIWGFDSIQKKVEEVAKESIIRLEFNKKLLVDNPDFIGNFSISAQVNDRPIQVGPYSVVGQHEYQIGFDQNSSKDNASYFLSTLIEADQIDSIWDRYSPVFRDRSQVFLKQNVNELLEYYNRNTADSVLNIKAPENRHIYNKIANVVMFLPSSSTLSVYLEEPLIFRNSEITGELLSIQQDLEQGNEFKMPARQRLEAYQSMYRLIEYTINYMDYFSEGGEKVVDAYLSLIQRDQVFFNRTRQRLKDNYDAMKILDTLRATNLSKFEGTLRNSTLQAQSLLSKLSDIKGTDLSRILNKNGYKSLSEISRNERKDVIKTLSENTGKDIFKRLVYASIDLPKADVQRNDKLAIYLNWYIDRPGTEGGEKPLKLHIGTFEVK